MSDEVSVDALLFVAFVRSALAFNSKAGSRLTELIAPCLAISIVLAEMAENRQYADVPTRHRDLVVTWRRVES